MKIRILLFVLMYVFALSAGPAAEIDSVTPRKVSLPNSLGAINAIINKRIEQGIKNANAQDARELGQDEPDVGANTKTCDVETLYTELRKSIFQSFTASWGLKGYDLDRQLRELLVRQSYSLPLNDSIYRDIDYLEGFSLNLKELSDVVRINGYLVGLDKIGHFFAQGWQYFEKTEDDGESLLQAIAWGREKETGLFGYTMTGIFSYADLVANLNGWRFWNRVLLKRDDPLWGTIGNFFARPYISCDVQLMDSIKAGKIVRAWEYNSRFDLADYIDGAWDEGNNCNSYADPIIEEKVAARIEQVDPDFVCPAVPGQCRRARGKYGDYARFVLHPRCLTAR